VRRRAAERRCTVASESPPPVARLHLASPACARRHAATALREPHPLPRLRQWPPQVAPGGCLATGAPALLNTS